MSITISPNPLPPFKILYELPAKTWMVINIGARGGGKSYEASKFCVIQATAFSKRIAVMRDEQTKIRQSIFNDCKKAFKTLDDKSEGYFSDRFDMQETELKTRQSTPESLMFTLGFKSSNNSKVAGLKSISDVDIAIIEELQDVTDEFKFNSLKDGIRNEGSFIFINSNVPDKNHWFVKRYFDLDATEYDGYFTLRPKEIEGVVYIWSTFKDNPYLQDHTVRNYNDYGNPNSPFYDKHYYLTEILGYCSAGKTGQIYTNWNRISNEEYNELNYKSIYGLDFGWGHSPMALGEMKFKNENVYIRELLYDKTYEKSEGSILTLAKKMITLGIGDSTIIADSAEKNAITRLRHGWLKNELSAEDLITYPQLAVGFNIFPCPAKDIKDRIQRVKEHKVYVTNESVNIWNEELPNYVYDIDKNGNPTDSPKEGHDHHMDWIGYVVTARSRHY